MDGAPRKRLDPESPRAGEEIEDAGAFELGLEDREQGLADAVGRDAGAAAARNDEGASLGLPGDDSRHASA